jgi:hypothetical protein
MFSFSYIIYAGFCSLILAMPASKSSASKEPAATSVKKKVIGKKSTAAAEVEEATKERKALLAKELKLKQSNFSSCVGLAKKRIQSGTSAEPEADKHLVEAAQTYGEMGRFNPEKKLLLANWQKDKTMSWWLVYEENRTKSFETTVTGAEGFGTKYLVLVYMFIVVYV